MNVLMICDSPNWAIGGLASIIVRHNPHINFRSLYVHPREVELHVDEVKAALPWADIVQMEYWNTAQQLLTLIPEIKDKKLILTHHNQKNLLSADWSAFRAIVCHTKKAHDILVDNSYPQTEIIPYGLDLNFWRYQDEIREVDHPVIGYAGRVVPWKNLKIISDVCFRLNLPLLFMGKMDKADYWESIPIEQRDRLDTSFMNCAAEDRPEFYHNCDIFVQFSSDGREEGTLPLLEAMACGTPVITSPAGVAADIIENEKNGLLVPFDDAEALKTAIKRLAADFELRKRLREAAWNTVRIMTEVKMARRYSDLYYRINGGNQPLVSIVTVVHEANGNLQKQIERVNEMTWQNIELVVCDDGAGDSILDIVKEYRKKTKVPIKYVATNSQHLRGETISHYGLAQARNRGIIEAQGEFILFCDARILPERDAIEQFYNELAGNNELLWLFGDKGTGKKTFVENFSFVRRKHVIDAGMFNERIDQYGGMSQELRSRLLEQGFGTSFVHEAKAEQLSSSHMSWERRKSIVAMKDLLFKIGY